MSKIDSIFAKLVKDHREVAGISQSELADKVELSRGSITNIEGARQGVSLEQALVIAKALGFSIAEVEQKMQALSLQSRLEDIPEDLRNEIKKLLR